MSDRFFDQDTASAQPGVVWIDLVATLGTSGASASATIAYQYGIKSLSDNGSGVYTITFQDGYVACLNIIENIIQASYSASGAVYFTWTTDTSNTGTPVVTLTARTAAGAAVQPATGDIIKLSFRMKRTRGDGTA